MIVAARQNDYYLPPVGVVEVDLENTHIQIYSPGLPACAPGPVSYKGTELNIFFSRTRLTRLMT